jgi:hypothetical protein
MVPLLIIIIELPAGKVPVSRAGLAVLDEPISTPELIVTLTRTGLAPT